MYRRSALAMIIALSTATALTACSSESTNDSSSVAPTAPDSETAAPDTSTPVVDSDASSMGNDADVAFLKGMIPHHQQAIEMADLALADAAGAGPEVLELAARIRAAQAPEIEQMTALLTEWGMADDLEHLGHMGHGEGMMTDDEMTALSSAAGASFDAMWLDMMIRHHAGAIAQAIVEQADGADPTTLALADAIIAAQQAEIAEMQLLLEG